MRPIPTAFHIGPLEVHTYGIGLALTFWFGFVYFERRLRKNGYPTEWLVPVFLWIILAAVVGARVVHVLSHLHTYTQHPGDIVAVWQGGLSSFGGLLFAVPTGILLTRRRCPELPLGRALDLAAPVLLACWAMGRLLGPQLMVMGGGHATHQWFGMYYADQVGRRLPVPIIQAIEDFLWLGEDGRVGSDLVQVAGLLLVVGGVVILLRTRARWSAWLRTHHAGDADQVVPARPTGSAKGAEPVARLASSERAEQAGQTA
jgi:hypothetical protein